MIDVVYALDGGQVWLPSGGLATVHKGQHWPASDPVVLAAPGLFTADPRCGLAYSAAPPGYDADLNELPKPAKRAVKAAPESAETD